MSRRLGWDDIFWLLRTEALVTCEAIKSRCLKASPNFKNSVKIFWRCTLLKFSWHFCLQPTSQPFFIWWRAFTRPDLVIYSSPVFRKRFLKLHFQSTSNLNLFLPRLYTAGCIIVKTHSSNSDGISMIIPCSGSV